MVNAGKYGFLPSNSGEQNARNLNLLLEQEHEIEVTVPGVYALSDTILIGSNTTLRFGEGVYIKRESHQEEAGYAFVNKGAYTREYDENITITGLYLICNGVECSGPTPGSTKIIPGLSGHVCFFYVKNLVIDHFTSLDLPSKRFGIHICTFENIRVENVVIEGRKDAVHLGRGKNFVIKNGYFKTFDDPIALNAHDYSTSNPQLGWIEDGLIENCYDYNEASTDGYFCRILAGSWTDWYKGMVIQRSDTVIHGGRMYRAIMEPDGKTYVSLTPPTHEKGAAFHEDIRWEFVQDEICYNCGCRNIRFKDIYIEKDRPVAISIHHDNDRWSRSVYPGSVAPVQENIVFENINILGKVPVFLSCISPLKQFEIKNSNLADAKIDLIELEQIEAYPEADFKFTNTEVCEISATPKRTYKAE